MRYAFVVNPASGKEGHDKGVIKAIDTLISTHGDEDIGLYYTDAAQGALGLSAELAEDAMSAEEDIVIFACGGDGTAHEVVNGIYRYENAILGLVPIGSGNDLCRALSKGKRKYKDYRDLDKQMKGHPHKIDVIRIRWKEDEEERSTLAINGVNIGFDGNTAIRAAELNDRTPLSGSLAYLAAVFGTLVKKDGQSLYITADGEELYNGDLLLATMGNGNYCGGGIESCPRASLDDGLIELMAIRDLPRLSFIAKFPKFKAGRLFEIKDADKIVCYRQAREITVKPLKADKMKFVIDGEIYNTSEIRAEIQPKSISVWEI